MKPETRNESFEWRAPFRAAPFKHRFGKIIYNIYNIFNIYNKIMEMHLKAHDSEMRSASEKRPTLECAERNQKKEDHLVLVARFAGAAICLNQRNRFAGNGSNALYRLAKEGAYSVPGRLTVPAVLSALSRQDASVIEANDR